MATNTTKLALSKPDGTDLVDVAVLNGNFDKIDAASGATICTSSTRPASPWNGQVIFETDTLNALVYRTSTTSWNILGGSTVASDPPAGAGNGNFWWDSDNGKLYIYYNDGNSGQWVSVMPSQTVVDVTENYIINGAFDIWQRGTSFTSTSYSADRWLAPVTNATVSREDSDLPAGFQYGIKFVTTAANGFAQFNQAIETANVVPLRGKTVTISGYIKISGSYTGNFISQALFSTSSDAYASQTTLVTGSNKNVANSSTTSWTRFVNTFTVPSDAVGMRIENIPDAVQPSGVTVRMTGIQLEVGPAATAFRRNAPSIAAELETCKRYFQRYLGANDYFPPQAPAAVDVTNRPEVNLFYTEKRVAPTITVNTVSQTSFSSLTTSANVTPSSFSGALIGTGKTGANLFFAGTWTMNVPANLYLGATASIDISAEL